MAFVNIVNIVAAKVVLIFTARVKIIRNKKKIQKTEARSGKETVSAVLNRTRTKIRVFENLATLKRSTQRIVHIMK